MQLKDLTLTLKGKFLNLYKGTYITEKGNIKEYEIVSRKKDLIKETFGRGVTKDSCDIKTLNNMHNNYPDAVGIIAFNEDMSKILLLREFRMACNEWVYNFPGGMIDTDDLSATEACKRELSEETGLDIVSIISYLPPAYSAVGISDETVKTIVCIANGEFKASNSEYEEIIANWYTKDEIRILLETKQKMALRTISVLWCWVNSDLLKD